MICCAFIFTPGEYDAEFHRLDDEIQAFAEAIPGFIKVESWLSPDGKSKNAMYYFEHMQAVRELSQFQQHLEAKSKVDRWYVDYRVEVMEVKSVYGK